RLAGVEGDLAGDVLELPALAGRHVAAATVADRARRQVRRLVGADPGDEHRRPTVAVRGRLIHRTVRHGHLCRRAVVHEPHTRGVGEPGEGVLHVVEAVGRCLCDVDNIVNGVTGV